MRHRDRHTSISYLLTILGSVCCGMAAAILLAACTADTLAPNEGGGEGRLRLSLVDISTTVTRSTPSQLAVPTADDFYVTITSEAGRNYYEGPFTTDEIFLPTGEYTVTAACGENSVLAIDKPYYVATKTATVASGELNTVSLTATVGNALVSAIFGIDEAERQRFDRFYSDYALYVAVGSNAIPITKDEPAKSIYVRAGTDVTLRFWGKLKFENDREVTMDLTSDQLPSSFNAADHAIVTLTLPDPESAMTVAISKVEVQELTLDETIPLSWLPVAMVVPMHQYDDDGTLLGTNVLVTESYPGMKWRTVIENAAGTVVRAMEGKGALQSYFYKNSAWPYLPQGTYKAKFYFFGEDEEQATLAATRDFTVEAPTINVTTSGYTSYSKYLEGDINAANACERCTVYEPTVSLNVAPDLLRNKNYSYTFSYTYDGTTTAVPAGINNYAPGDITGQAVRREPYVLRASATFDGVTATAQRDLYITGLPYALNLQSHDEWDASGGVDWYNNDVRLGHLSTGSQYIQTTTSICLPPSTYFCADYSVNVHTLTVGTYLSIKAGDNEILKIEEAATPFRDTDHMHSGTTSVCHDDNAYITKIHCYNDYGAGQTCSHIYSLAFKYANH